MTKQRKHGYTFLTRPRWIEKDISKADKSFFVWGYHNMRGCYTLSLLGVINGILNKVGFVMYCDIDKETKAIKKWHISRKWW